MGMFFFIATTTQSLLICQNLLMLVIISVGAGRILTVTAEICPKHSTDKIVQDDKVTPLTLGVIIGKVCTRLLRHLSSFAHPRIGLKKVPCQPALPLTWQPFQDWLCPIIAPYACRITVVIGLDATPNHQVAVGGSVSTGPLAGC